MTDRLFDSTLPRLHSGYAAARRIIGVLACILLLVYGVQQLTNTASSHTAETPSVDTDAPKAVHAPSSPSQSSRSSC